MERSFNSRLFVVLCALACAATVVMGLWSSPGSVRTEDQNGDGRPDIWRTYDHQGRLSEVAVDTNFDGRSDVHEYYDRSILVRRESDRDFNGRVDLVQEFEPSTRQPVRSVEDVDFDGTADLLVLFQGGEPVLARRTRPLASADPAGTVRVATDVLPRTADDRLAPFDDPFELELALRATRTPIGASEWIGLSTSGGLPSPALAIAGPVSPSSSVSAAAPCCPSSISVLPYTPRGPPLVLSLV